MSMSSHFSRATIRSSAKIVSSQRSKRRIAPNAS